ncbi:sideroflexin [Plakobranchus ocellatus]|uniref:Sidoreflexin n=1 Tax=Plakobranchus ocellatus TaxID=259542 RepID=A0AAV4AN46_9GAST|nr:sideroflexin [Plakobranchus ocellatus]
MEKVMQSRIDVNKSPFDLSTFWGRVKHYAWVTDPRLTILSTKQLNESRDLLDKYRKGEEDPGTTEHEVRKAQQQYLSAFHPDTGDLQNVVGRMSFQVPGGMVLIGAMITFYKSNTAVIFWQWANQSFNALVNYTNSNATSEVNTKQLVTAYVSATSSALVVALGLKRYLHTRASPLMQRFVPFAAVAAANAVNIPLMRQNELLDGVTLMDEKGESVIKSKYAALKGISQVVTARICMATPSMTLLPVFMERLEKTRTFRRHTWLGGICQVLFSGMILLVTVPVSCAIFPQKCSISSDKLNILDHKRVEELKQAGRMTLPATLYFNKGL